MHPTKQKIKHAWSIQYAPTLESKFPTSLNKYGLLKRRKNERCSALLKRRANYSIKPTHQSLHLIECYTRAASICSFFWIVYPKKKSIYSQTITIVTHKISFCVHIVLTTISSLSTMHTNTQQIVNYTCIFFCSSGYRCCWMDSSLNCWLQHNHSFCRKKNNTIFWGSSKRKYIHTGNYLIIRDDL